MSSPLRERQIETLKKFSDFAEIHNKKDITIKKIIKRLYRLNLDELKSVKNYIKGIR
ncbi:hypothetical protein [Campylobacter gastrosuis]|uniref:Uncharacterized protein n=1 Tax=Campylobacter gastrosuis TaxID=2974576 RepID=A0ABT7HTE2_9BACT|nr:hypothetical protein [Campylobacter gastrosuis]MDL0089990.1 hypothetical protein [Campylobacter gastrosuis]